MSHRDCVLIAGAGPVGMVTGLALARAGIPVKMFDEQATVPTDHRASTLHPSTLSMLEPLAMTDTMLGLGLPSPQFQFRDRVSDEIVAEFDYALLADETPYPLALQLEQHKIIEIAHGIAMKLAEFELAREHVVKEVQQDDDHVEIVVETPDGAKRAVQGRYLIGCDGGRSIVRKSQNIDFPGFTWQERFIIVSTHFDFAAAAGFRYRNYIAHPEQWSALIKVPGEHGEGVWRALFPAMTDESDETVLEDAWIQRRYATCYPYEPPYEILHRNLYNVHQRVAASFRAGRVLLAGDAAHVNNPVGGMGMNSGIHDGLNLADKLGRIWRGEAGEELLDLYDRQRRPMATKYVQAQSIRNKEMLQETDPKLRQERLDGLRKTAEDPEKAKAFLRQTSLIAMVEEANAIS